MLRKSIDEHLEKCIDKDVLMFPLNTRGAEGRDRNSGDHWTLLKLNVKTYEWRFYNLMRQRSSSTVDVHLTRSLIVVIILLFYFSLSESNSFNI